MEKLFIHLLTKGIEYYGSTPGSVREIFAILDTPEEILYENLQEAYQQSHRLRLLKENNIGLSMDDIKSDIDHDSLPESLLKDLLEPQVTIEQLRKLVKYQIKNHDKTKLQ